MPIRDAPVALARPDGIAHLAQEGAHLVSTLLLTENRQHTSSHPPDAQGREILTIPDRDGQQRLSLADRLRLRVGLWLLHRSLEVRSPSASEMYDLQRQAIDARTAMTLLTYGQQRGLR